VNTSDARSTSPAIDDHLWPQLADTESLLDPDIFTFSCERTIVTDRDVGTCTYLTKNPDEQNKDVIFFLHPFSTDEKILHTHPDLAALLNKMGRHSPMIVSITYHSNQVENFMQKLFGRSFPFWFMSAQVKNKGMSGTLEHFTEVLTPHILSSLEATHSLIGSKTLVGISMGGFNALTVYGQRASLFDRYAVLCPALVDFTPYDPLSAIKGFVRRAQETGAQVDGRFAYGFYGANRTFFFESAEHFKKTSPYHVIKPMQKTLPPLWFSANEQDSMGFYPPAMDYVQHVEKLAVSFQNHSIPGGHCKNLDQIQSSLTDFLLSQP